jgi:hypothetical protein
MINLRGCQKDKSAQDWIRTSTSLRTLRPEHSASTNFATWAAVFIVANIEKDRTHHELIPKQLKNY